MTKFRFTNTDGDLYTARANDYQTALLKAKDMLGDDAVPYGAETEAAANVEQMIAEGKVFSF